MTLPTTLGVQLIMFTCLCQTLELTLAMTLVAYMLLLSSCSTHVHFAPSIRIDVAHSWSMVSLGQIKDKFSCGED
jgi:hypothetical protein